MNLNRYKKLLQRSTLSCLSRTCDVVIFSFDTQCGNEVRLHVLGTFRMVDKEHMLLVAYEDMFLRGKEYKKKKFKYDTVGGTVFDDKVKEHNSKFIDIIARDVEFKGRDLYITLENDVKIEVTVYSHKDDTEFYRLFMKNDLDSHYVVENL